MNKKIERTPNDQLKSHCNAVRAHIRRTRKNSGDTRDAEVELCYLEREEEHRAKTYELDRVYRAKMEILRKQEFARMKEEEAALKAYWEGHSGQGIDD